LFSDASLFAFEAGTFLFDFGVADSLTGLGAAGFLVPFFTGVGSGDSFSDSDSPSASSSELLESSSTVSFEVMFFLGLLRAAFSSLLLALTFFLPSLVFFLVFLGVGLLLGLGHRQNSSIRSMIASLVPPFSRHR
jgi:hypothetical protein